MEFPRGSRFRSEFFFAFFLFGFFSKFSESTKVFKRQTTNSPYFSQSSYTFNLTSCSSGIFIATVTANNPGGGSIAYSIDNGTGSPGNMAVNYQTGQLNLASSTTTGSFSFNYRATNFYGAAVVPITITCGSSSSNNGISIFCFNGFCTNTTGTNSSSSTSYTFNISSCSSGATVGTVSYSNTAVYALSSSTSLFTLNPTSGLLTLASSVSAGTYTLTIYAYTSSGGSTTLTVTVTVTCSSSSSSSGSFSSGLTYICFGGFCYGTNGVTTSSSSSSSGAASFGSSSYSLTSSGCSSGSTVGTVTASNANTYGITSGSSGFTISSSGVITLSSALSAGTYVIVVTAYGTSGNSSTTVTITVSCSTSSSSSSSSSLFINSTCLYDNCNFSSVPPVFASSPYSFAQTSCVIGTTVGTVFATNATNYFIETGPWSNYYIINSTTGVITEVGVVPTDSSVFLTVTATNRNGVPANVLVTISTTGCVTSTSTSSSTSTIVSTFSPSFSQSSYTLTQATSAIGTIGTVAATNAASYFFSSGNNGGFSISSTGVITATVAQPAGTYNLIETACTSAGVCVSVPVTIVVASAAATGTPVFGASSYSLFLASSNCVTGSAVGQVFATNAVTYVINNGNPSFTIDSSGNISTSSTVAANTYVLQVTAISSSGATSTVTVTIDATSCP